mgnify:CR=1 FL=1
MGKIQIEKTSLVVRQPVPFPKEVLKFLLEHEAEINNVTVRRFLRYAAWLYKCTAQEIPDKPGGEVELLRWETGEGGSYGYDPASVAYFLRILNKLFFIVIGSAYLNVTGQSVPEEQQLNTQLSIELLKGLAAPLGYFVLVSYLAIDASKHDTDWLDRACDVFGDFRDLETWRPSPQLEQSGHVRRIISAAQTPDEPYYFTGFPEQIQYTDPRVYTLKQVPNAPYYANDRHYQGAYADGYKAGYLGGHQAGYQQYLAETNLIFSKAGMIAEAERKRLVVFLKSLRQTLAELQDDPLMVSGSQEVPATNSHSSVDLDSQQPTSEAEPVQPSVVSELSTAAPQSAMQVKLTPSEAIQQINFSDYPHLTKLNIQLMIRQLSGSVGMVDMAKLYERLERSKQKAEQKGKITPQQAN